MRRICITLIIVQALTIQWQGICCFLRWPWRGGRNRGSTDAHRDTDKWYEDDQHKLSLALSEESAQDFYRNLKGTTATTPRTSGYGVDYKQLYQSAMKMYYNITQFPGMYVSALTQVKDEQCKMKDVKCKIIDRYVITYYELFFINVKKLSPDVEDSLDLQYINEHKKFITAPDAAIKQALQKYNIPYNQNYKVPVPFSEKCNREKFSLRDFNQVSIFERWVWFLDTIDSIDIQNEELQFLFG